MSSTKRDQFVEGILRKLSLEQKVGGTMILDFMGTVVPPYVHRIISDFHVAGLRVDTTIRGKPSYVDEAKDEETRKKLMRGNRAPAGNCRDFVDGLPSPFCTPADYARMGNDLRKLAIQRPAAVPIHFVLDQEGNGNENYALGDVRLFPPPMGLAASNDENLVYRAGKALARQLRAGGINWIHSPQVDVNTNHNNPEVNVRGYSDDPDKVTRFALATFRAFTEEKLVATAKHFPGRGASDMDAHLGLPVIDISRPEMDLHLQPYRALIAAGLPAIMSAHTVFPALDPDEPATLSKKILTDLLRNELGFDGVVTTDNMLMGGILARYEVPEACTRALLAGADLLLLRTESPMCEEIFRSLLAAVREGRLPVERLDEANRRVLRVKYDYGLFENAGLVDPEQAAAPQHDPEVIRIECEAAEKATLVRDRANLLPLKPTTRVLLVEQIHRTHLWLNNQRCHPSLLWEKLTAISPNAFSVEFVKPDEAAKRRIFRRVHEADVIVMTNYVTRLTNQDMAPLARELMQTGKPVIVVTNSPFAFGSPEDLPTVINVFSANPESLRVAAEILYGRRHAEGVSPIATVQ